MRVERFSLFFGRTKLRWQRGETEYGVGWLPLGGFVKITGMNPAEEIPPEVAHRAYYRQPVWKRIVVILAGPVVNIVLAFLILVAPLLGPIGDPREAEADEPDRAVTKGTPAAGVLAGGRPHPGRRRQDRRPRRAAQADRLAHVRRRRRRTAARPPSRSCWSSSAATRA